MKFILPVVTAIVSVILAVVGAAWYTGTLDGRLTAVEQGLQVALTDEPLAKSVFGRVFA